MSCVGIAFPDSVDPITQKDDSVCLVVVEERALSEQDAPALQTMLNNYISYALDGQMATHYPETRGKRVSIRVDLYASPPEFVLDFFRAYEQAIFQYGVALVLSIDGVEASGVHET